MTWMKWINPMGNQSQNFETNSPDVIDVSFAEAGVTTKTRKYRKRSSPPSLRPPTLMIDLLFGALMLFAFQMGDPNSVNVISKDLDLPTSTETTSKKKHNFLPLKPVRSSGSNWRYQLPNGNLLSADAIAELIKEKNKTAVLLVSSTTQVQNYIDAELPLRRLGLKVGLAVDVKQGEQK